MKKFIALLLTSFMSFALFAQSADKVSEIISTKEATYGQAAYLAASALGVIQNSASYDDALNALKERGVVSSSVKSTDAITMKELSWVCSHAWKVEGSLMLKLFKASRYTFRQMKADDVIPSSADPMDIPSGRNLLGVITDCINRYQVRAGEEM